jgi:hypothetical protein
MTITANYPAIRPTLSLDFANTEVLDPRITFSRPTTATYYDAKTSAVAEQNLVFPSQAFSTWANVGVTVVDNTTTAPDGTTTASSFTQGAGTNYRANSPSITTGLAYTFSFYAKAFSTNYIQVVGGSSGFDANTWANFDLSLGVVGSKGSSATSTITSVGSGWYRCTMTATSTATGSSNSFALSVIETATTGRFGGVVSSGSVYLWGAQQEQRSSATAYTPTTTTAITNYIPVLQTASSNTARFDHDPVTRTSLGLLIEEQRTNLLTYSGGVGGTGWTLQNSTVNLTAGVAPDGTQTFSKYVLNNGSIGSVYKNTLVGSGAVTVSIYAKAAEWGFVCIQLGVSFSPPLQAFVNLSTGAVTGNTGTGVTVTNVGNGVWRITGSSTWANSSDPNLYIQPTNSSSSFTTGNGFAGVYLWGAQSEAGSFATSYIPTVASQVTRSADSASMTGTNFSSWFNIGQGTFYGDAIPITTTLTTSRILGTTPVAVGSYLSMSATGVASTNGWYNAGLTSLGTQLVENKTTIEYSPNKTFAGLMNGGSLVSSTASDFTGTATGLTIGLANVTYMNGWIKKISYYPLSLTTAQLQGLTG